MIELSSKGSFSKTDAWFTKMSNKGIFKSLSRYGQEGVNALANATPTESGETARSWTYEVLQESNSWSIIWSNTHMAGDTPVVILLQYGHGTGTGGYVEGIDFINPAIQPIFDRIANDVWKAVTS